MLRHALVAANAAGSPEGVTEVLRRFGFGKVSRVAGRDAALARLREENFDLAVIPIDGITSDELLSLERSIRRHPHISVIATAAAAEPDLIVRAMRVGVHEFLVNPPTPEELAGSVERLARRSRTGGDNGELVAVYSGKGGLGTTSVAVNLAQAFSRLSPETRTAVVDFVPNDGDVRVLLDLKPSYDLSHLVAKGNLVDAELLDSVLTPCPGGLWALPAGDNLDEQEHLDAETATRIIGVLRSQFAMTVADCEHNLSEATLSVLDAADRIVLVTQLTVPSLRSTQRSVSAFRRLGYDDAKVCIVVSRHHSRDVLTVSDAEELLQARTYWRLPNDFKLSSQAVNTGVPVLRGHPGSKLSRSYIELARKLLGRRGQQEATTPARGAARLFLMFRKDKGMTNVT